jgi:hypothetical protein
MATKGIINCQREGGRRFLVRLNLLVIITKKMLSPPLLHGLPLSKIEEQRTNYYIQTNVQYDIFIVLFLICLQNKRRALYSAI